MVAHQVPADSVVVRMSATGQVSPCSRAAVCGARRAYESRSGGSAGISAIHVGSRRDGPVGPAYAAGVRPGRAAPAALPGRLQPAVITGRGRSNAVTPAPTPSAVAIDRAADPHADPVGNSHRRAAGAADPAGAAERVHRPAARVGDGPLPEPAAGLAAVRGRADLCADPGAAGLRRARRHGPHPGAGPAAGDGEPATGHVVHQPGRAGRRRARRTSATSTRPGWRTTTSSAGTRAGSAASTPVACMGPAGPRPVLRPGLLTGQRVGAADPGRRSAGLRSVMPEAVR